MVHSVMGSMHAIAALAAIVLGFAVTVLPKGRAPHRLLGLAYLFAMLMTNVSALTIYDLTRGFNLFHAFALLSLFLVLTGLLMPIARPRNWVFHHAHLMGWSYLGLLAAAMNEAAIRLPLHVDTPPRILAVGALLAVATGLVGAVLRPRWERAALKLAPAGRR
ncbi:MAG TPA: DUF2306 domain-containing protein [Rhizomicrobium sp.]|nr:DUF2306 domain-containing protein [Rhizomicrobium sp.]